MNNVYSIMLLVLAIVIPHLEMTSRQDTVHKTPLHSAQTPGYLPNRVFIRASSKLNYAVSFDNVHWIVSSIGSISHPDSWRMDTEFYIKVVTANRKPVVYKLVANKYYSIDWNKSKGCWDVFSVSN
ncbi:hypothetical protein AAFN85_13640 [Mucilaginibacter sp. CAU 1740]|uniref:hypothetical protein n=1 Tax=Mucilaginibacter sp. CAU 1740 TaxID=3140365 RepID=UPI00325A472E